MKKIIVIGGGPAGMMAAIAAADGGTGVILLEKNEKLGKKLFITGKGRCNVTNAAELETLFANVVSNPKFLFSAFYQFDNRAVMRFLESAGCKLKVERGERVFPVSDHSSDVIGALTRELQRRGVDVRLHTRAGGLLVRNGARETAAVISVGKGPSETRSDDPCVSDGISGTEGTAGISGTGAKICGVLLEDGRRLEGDAVILATGGCSYAATGSTGDGYGLAVRTGHRLMECFPSLVPLAAEERWCGDLMGLSLRNVTVRLLAKSRLLYEGFGEMLFTHFGVSGPLILSASSYYAQELRRRRKKGAKADAALGRRSGTVAGKESGTAGGKQPEAAAGRRPGAALPDCRLLIDLKPALSLEQLDRRILRDFEESKNKQFKNDLNGLFPARLIPVMIALSGIDPEKRVNEITREERAAFAGLVKALPLTVAGTRDFDEAIITKGRVDVRDVNPSTMESRKLPGLYFAGEVLDLDALTGGFNLQIAWSTGYLAGESAAERVADA